MKISKKWWKMATLYKRFASEHLCVDFSEEAALEMYRHETFGLPLGDNTKLNGYSIGKKWTDITVAAWKEDLDNGNLLVSELIEDDYPEWFLIRIGVIKMSKADVSDKAIQGAPPVSEGKIHSYPQDDLSIPSLVELERDFLQETIVHGFANWSEGGFYANISIDADLFESIKSAHLAKHTRV